MKTLRILIFGLLATATFCQAQITYPGWFITGQGVDSNSLPEATSPPQDLTQTSQPAVPRGLQNTTNAPGIAEAITPEIQTLAQGLQNDPIRIFNYVHDHIRYVLYFGSKKGAQLTLLEKSGNDFDQCALLVALLRAAGYNNVGYYFGFMGFPYDDPSHRDLHHWLQLNLTNSNWGYTSNYLKTSFHSERGYPAYAFLTGDTNTFLFQRTWVTLKIGSTVYYLDPAFKISEPVPGISNLASVIGLSSNALMTAAAGTDAGNYVTNLNETNLRNILTGYTTNLIGYLQSNYPNASVQQILSGWQIVPSTNNSLSAMTWPNNVYGGGNWNPTNWVNEPTNLMSALTVTFAGTNYQWFMPQLQGQRVALTFDTNGLAQLWQDDALLAQHSTGGSSSTTNVVLSVTHPFGTWDYVNNVLIPGTYANQIVTNSYQRTNATYALIYAFEPDWGRLQQRQKLLDGYRQQGLADTSRQVTSETLNVMGLNWTLQAASAEQLLATQLGISVQYQHRLGRMAQEIGRGYYVDVYMQLAGEFSKNGIDVTNNVTLYRHFDIDGYFESAFEHGVIEQLQNTNLVGASTVKMLQLANANGQAIYLASSTNWTTVKSALLNYDSATTNSIYTNYINNGYYVLLPQNGSNHVSAVAGSWAGSVYLGNSLGSGYMTFTISGGYHGGYSSDPSATVNPPYVAQTGDSQPNAFTPVRALTPNANITGADPVNIADGTFRVETTDLSVGGAEPRGLNLSRYYISSRQNNNPAGMAGGWLHNYYMNATTVAAPQTGLGDTTPAQMAPMLVATCAAASLYNRIQPDPKNWMVTALIAKWGIDQLINNGVSVMLGKDAIQFVKQPDGSFTPPANCTWTLKQTNSVYNLVQRHGNTFKFDSLGRLTNIVDQYGQPLTVTYLNTTSSLPHIVTDWKGRSLTFNYTGSQLTSVSDGTRAVSYGYSTTYNPQGDLTSFTDAESKTSTYGYDTNHQITATFDAQSRLVVSNIYDSQGHVVTQYTQGDTNKTWQIFWSGWQTVEQNPAGGQRQFFYDDKSRLIGLQDALGNLSQTTYDGQDHVVMTVSPLNETNLFIYDGNNNLLRTIDPLNFTNRFIYDNQNNLTQSVDARGNTNKFCYNTQFSLTGQTNGAGDWVSYIYNTSGTNSGTLASCTDSAGTTSYGYDSAYGQLNSITYPGSLGSESFTNSSFGDVTSHTDANRNVTTFSYNNRRQLTNTIAPTNLTVRIAYDSVGNVANTTDARNNTSSNTWSATRHLLTTTLPATPQGVPMVTNIYDSRDWLLRTINNPLSSISQTSSYTNDAAQRLISVTDPLLRTTTFGFDADGHQIGSTNAALEHTLQQWSARGELLKLTDNAGHTIQHLFDATGNQITLTNRNGKRWQFQFDAANRLTNTITPLNRKTRQTYNNRGLLATVTDPANQPTSFYYDAKGRLTNRTDNVGSTYFSFDAGNNRTNVSENGKSNSWTFDAYNRISSYRDTDGNLIQYRFDANANLTNLIYPGGRTVTYLYDNLNRLTNVNDWASRKTSIAYDLAGRVTSVTRPNGTQRLINYDAAGETTNIIEQVTNKYPIAYFKLNWNSNSTVQWEFAAPLPHTSTPPTRTMTYDDDNRLATFNGQNVLSDLDGNLTNAPLTNSTFASYTYDARNRLLNVGGTSPHTYTYDTLGNRTSVSNSTGVARYVINPNSKLSQSLMRIRNGVTNYYVYGVGLLYEVDETATSTNMLTYHFDYRGSTVALTDSNGIPTDRYEYSAYGMTTYRAGTNDTPFLFNGRYGVQTDQNGLLFMRARYYNPYICRFINPDPSGFSGGLNFYAYANGNPISYLDPFGLVSWGLLGKSTFGFVANGVVAVGGALLAETGVGAVAAVYGAYGAGANFGNIINALKDTPAGPTGPAQTLANVAYPSSQTANNVGQVIDLTANLATGNELGSEGEIASAAGLVTAAQYDFATLNFANKISTVYQGATYVDAGLTTYDAWRWTGEGTTIPGSSTPIIFSPTSSTFNQPVTSPTGSSTGK